MPTYTSRSGASRVWRWLGNVPPYPKTLAWCHTTDAYLLRSIIEGGSFTPRLCPVFGEELLYFFYGRPAFRHSPYRLLGIGARAPVVVVLAPDLVASGKRLFPFDSGAFDQKRYAKWMHSDMQLPDFEMACHEYAPQRHVAAFFKTNIDYLRVKFCTPTLPFHGEHEVGSIIAMLTDSDIASADDRRLALELQVGDPLPFTPPTIRALILPEEFLQAPYVDAYLKGPGTGISIATYDLQPLKQGKEYQNSLAERAKEFNQNWGLT